VPCASRKNARQTGVPCACLKTHGKGTVLAVGFGHFAVRLLENTHLTLQFIFFGFHV
jgi:hypothetical protein